MKPTESQLDAVGSRWDLTGEVRFLRRVANYVYEGTLAGRPIIVRLTETSRRTREELSAEMNWMDYLAREGVRLARPIPSRGGLFVEEVAGENPFHACVFEKALGGTLKDVPPDTWGRYLGRMHRLTQQYPKPAAPRQAWDQDDVLTAALRGMDAADVLPYRRMNELMAWLRNLPQEKSCYGLVHADLHSGNFFVHEGEITAFDFDDSCYHWFAYDLATPLISMNLHDDKPGVMPEAAVLAPFLKGYRSENTLDPVWLDRLELFGKYRAALVYHWIKDGMRQGIFDEKALAWCRERLPWCREQFEKPLELF